MRTEISGLDPLEEDEERLLFDQIHYPWDRATTSGFHDGFGCWQGQAQYFILYTLNSRSDACAIALRCGFPLKSFHGWASFDNERPKEQQVNRFGLIGLRSGWPATLDSLAGQDLVPLAPLWPGLLANTVVYAGSLWLLAFCFDAARRAVRHRRGRCRLCGYNLKGNTSGMCPECGAAALGSESPVMALTRSALSRANLRVRAVARNRIVQLAALALVCVTIGLVVNLGFVGLGVLTADFHICKRITSPFFDQHANEFVEVASTEYPRWHAWGVTRGIGARRAIVWIDRAGSPKIHHLIDSHRAAPPDEPVSPRWWLPRESPEFVLSKVPGMNEDLLPDDMNTPYVGMDGYGFPFPAMRGWYVFGRFRPADHQILRVEGGVAIGTHRSWPEVFDYFRLPIVLPYEIVPRGFVINSAIYALMAAMFLAAASWRRQLRRRSHVWMKKLPPWIVAAVADAELDDHGAPRFPRIAIARKRVGRVVRKRYVWLCVLSACVAVGAAWPMRQGFDGWRTRAAIGGGSAKTTVGIWCSIGGVPYTGHAFVFEEHAPDVIYRSGIVMELFRHTEELDPESGEPTRRWKRSGPITVTDVLPSRTLIGVDADGTAWGPHMIDWFADGAELAAVVIEICEQGEPGVEWLGYSSELQWDSSHDALVLLDEEWRGIGLRTHYDAVFRIAGPAMTTSALWCFGMAFVTLILLVLLTPQRRVRGFCSACGYDLMGNASGRCPECGVESERVKDNEPRLGRSR